MVNGQGGGITLFNIINIYKNTVPNTTQQNLAKRSMLLKKYLQEGITKIIRLKIGHSMLKGHKSKIDPKTQPECTFCKVQETPELKWQIIGCISRKC